MSTRATDIAGLGWLGVVRIGVAQMALGSLVVLATSTLNRIMVVELALPAIVPGLLIGLHYALQVLRPRWGYASDRTANPARWIVGGMALLAAGVLAAAAAAALTRTHGVAGIALATLGYAAIGVGVGAAGTSLLTLLACTVAAPRRPAAATIAWLMMILGSAVTAGAASHFLQPFSFARLLQVVAVVAAGAVGLTALAVWRVAPATAPAPSATGRAGFAAALRTVWADPASRRFAVFIFVSMLAYSGQELIIEPFAGLVFNLPPGGTAALMGLQQAGVLAGMLLVAFAGTAMGGRLVSMRVWTIGGCLASALLLLALAACAALAPVWTVRPCLLALGVANGTFAVSAIGAMMQVAVGRPRQQTAGTSMGLFGAAQAIAFGGGGLASSGASDLARAALGGPLAAYCAVFIAEALLFLYAAALASRIFAPGRVRADAAPRALGSLS